MILTHISLILKKLVTSVKLLTNTLILAKPIFHQSKQYWLVLSIGRKNILSATLLINQYLGNPNQFTLKKIKHCLGIS